MGTISSGIGLVSGLDINALVNGLLAVDARPRDLIQQRINAFNGQSAALLGLSGQISGILSRITSLMNASAFKSMSVNSSAASVLSAIANGTGSPTVGTYSFIVKALAATHQLVSHGVASASTELAPGSLTIESAQARVNTSTTLDELNGFSGVSRGSLKLTDSTGKQATVNLADAVTVADVLDRINNAGLNIRAGVKGDSLTLTEKSGGTIRIEDINGGSTAASLGFDATRSFSSAGSLTGNDIMSVTANTSLSLLNDRLGVRTAKAGTDFTINDVAIDLSEILKDTTKIQRINHGAGADLGTIRIKTTDAAGQSVSTQVDLSGATTMGEIRNRITQAVPGLAVTLSGGHMLLGYADGKTRPLAIEDVTGHAARDLGIANSSDTGKLTGGEVLQVRTLADVKAAINYAEGNDGSIKASLTDNGLQLDAAAPLVLKSLNGSKALSDLGFKDDAYASDQLVGSRLIGGLNTVLLKSLNGGAGFTLGTISVSAGSQSFNVDLTSADSLNDVLDTINQAAAQHGAAVTATVDASGTKLSINSADGATPVTIADVSGNFAAMTGINQSGVSINGDNLQRRYVSENTRLTDLNQGRGAALGKFKITDSTGVSQTIDLTAPPAQTLQDVITAINNSGAKVQARVNDTGDGLLLSDTGGGALALKVEEDGGTIAHDLNLLGTSSNGSIDGSYELKFDVAAGDTLDKLVARINDNGLLGKAAVLFDGGGVNGYRLHLTSNVSGLGGELLLSDSLGLGFSTLTQAQDAKVLLGSDPNSGVLLRSSTNSFTNAVPGLTLDLQSASDTPTTITVAQNSDSLVATLQGFVDNFNKSLSMIKDLGGYDSSSQKSGALLGDSTLQRVQDKLYRLLNSNVPGASGAIRRLSQLGITLKEGQLNFDAEKFKSVLASNPQAVQDFFTNSTSGAAAYMKKQLEDITDSSKGLIVSRTNTLGKTIESLNGRITSLNTLLDLKRTRLTRQFNTMESVLSQLKSQQSALSQLSNLANGGGGG